MPAGVSGWSGRRVTALNRYIVARDGGQCWVPGCDRPGDTVDHIAPQCERPDLMWDTANMRAACFQHNVEAGAKLGAQRLAAKRSVQYAGASRDW